MCTRRSDQEVEREFAEGPEYPGGYSDSISITLDIRLVTVMYGGGPTAGYPDEITPFRPSAIRGHLRFWWRATRGARFTTWEELREQEARVWGDAETPSAVRVEVECPANMRPTRFPLREYERDANRRYALFPPFEEKVKRLDERRLQRGGGFRLTVSLRRNSTELRDDVDAALWAWLNLGGLGARTRRGAGALYCAQYAGWSPSRILGDGTVRDWPVLKGGILICGAQPSPWQKCWDDLLRFYREFRQDRGLQGRGKTNWPEPDQIRNLRQHGGQPTGGFPRGVLGLPIIFHFKDRWDPSDQILSCDSRNGRMASPVILRPLAISNDQALPVILVLNARKPGTLQLFEAKAADDEGTFVQSGPRNAVAELISRAQSKWATSPVLI